MDCEIPELEDCSEIIQTAKERNLTRTNTNSNSSESKSKNEILKNQKDFCGMKKGFLTNGISEKKSKSDNVPFLKVDKTKNVKSNLIFEEVQQERNKNNWLNDDLLKSVSDDSQLSEWLTDPRTSIILSDFEKNPQAAIVKYKDDEKTQQMLVKFGHLLGGHFSKLQPAENVQRDPNEVIIPGRERGTAPEIRASVDNCVDAALATAGVKEALMDPDIQRIIESLRSDPDSAHRLIRDADRKTHDKLRLLVESGVLGVQQ